MAKIAEYDFRKGSLADSVTGGVLVPTSKEFVRGDKGLCSKGTASASLYTLPNTISLFGSTTRTVEAWIKISNNSSVGRYKRLISSSSNFGILPIYAGTNVFYVIGTGGGIYWDKNLIADGKWHHIILEVSGTVANNKLYLDGSLRTSAGSVGTTMSELICTQLDYEPLTPSNEQGGLMKFVVYDHIFTEKERANAYKDFLNSYPIVKEKYPCGCMNKPLDLSRENDNTVGQSILPNPLNFTSIDWVATAGAIKLNDHSFESVGTSRINSPAYTFVLNTKYRLRVRLNVTAGVIFYIRDYNNTNTYYSYTGTGNWVNIDTYFTVTTIAGTGITLRLAAIGIVDFDYLIIEPITGLVAAYNFIPNGNTCVDLSGSGRTMSLTGKVISTSNGIKFVATASSNQLTHYGTISNPPTLSIWSVCASIKVDYVNSYFGIVGNSNAGTVDAIQYNLNWGFYKGAYNNFGLNTCPLNVWQNLCFISNGITITMYRNGEYIGVVTPSSTSLEMKYINIWLRTAGAEWRDLRIYNRVLTANEIKAYHNQFVNPSLVVDFSDEGADGVSKVPSGFVKTSGSFKISEVTTDDPVIKTIKKGTKFLQCITAGVIAIPSKQAYGTWEFDWFKGADGNILITYPIRNTLSLLDSGYLVGLSSGEQVILYKRVTGANTSLATSATSYIANNTWYRIRITRSLSGVFTVLIKGGAFTPTAGYDGWTLVSTSGGTGTNPVTDNTYTTSEYFVLDIDAGDRITNIVLKEGIEI